MDRRIQKTKQSIRQAYFELLNEEPKRKITITSIASLANIDRKTFYLHYETMDDIIQEYYQEIAEVLVSELKKANFPEDKSPILRLFEIFNRILEENIVFFRQVSSHPEYHYFFDKMTDIIVERVVVDCGHLFPFTDEELGFYATFYISGIVSVYTLWNKQGRSMDSNRLASMMGNASYRGLEYLIETKNQESDI